MKKLFGHFLMPGHFRDRLGYMENIFCTFTRHYSAGEDYHKLEAIFPFFFDNARIISLGTLEFSLRDPIHAPIIPAPLYIIPFGVSGKARLIRSQF